jgi:putative ABC transport system substrate-binding protein
LRRLHTLGLETRVVNASTELDLEAAFASSLARGNADALIIGGDAFTFRARTSIAALAARHAIPALFWSREYGGMSAKADMRAQ